MVLLLFARSASAAAPLCGTLASLAVTTPSGFCVGIVAEGLKSPRGLQLLPNGDIVVADMGSWRAGQGIIWLLRPNANGYEKRILFDQLDRPNGVALGRDRLVYVGMVTRVARFDPASAHPILTDVIGGTSGIAPLPGDGRHLLSSLLFDPDGDLLVNVGSASDHCEDGAGLTARDDGRCLEGGGPEPRGAIRKYVMKWPAGVVQSWESYALGLRNSMAIAIEPRSGALWQGENARDGINAAMPGLKNDDELPHDELNLIIRGAHYGWPYCYDKNLASPEFPTADCSQFRAPVRLLPAHAAPLGMAFYSGSSFPARFHNSLIISYHGYRKHGHRLVALLADRRGNPFGKSVDLVTGSRKGRAGTGAPVGVQVGADGNVYFTDDHSGRVLMLHYAQK